MVGGLADELDGRLRDAGRLAAVLSPHLTVEEAYLLAKFVRGDRSAGACWPWARADRSARTSDFPNGFTIRAEKCPNRRGVEAIIAHFMRTRADVRRLARGSSTAGEFGGVWVSGGYKAPWIDEATAAAVRAACKLLVVQDLFPSPLSERATYELPGAAFAERDGSYVNHADRLQSARWAIRPPAGVRAEGSLYWQLLGRTGLYNSRARAGRGRREILYFSAAAGPVPRDGRGLEGQPVGRPRRRQCERLNDRSRMRHVSTPCLPDQLVSLIDHAR